MKSVAINAIHTDAAPAPIGAYSQAVKIGNMVYLSGQIPKSAKTNQMITGDIIAEVEQIFDNLTAVAKAAGGALNQIVKLTIFLTDLADFAVINNVMMARFQLPYPARSTIQVAALPAGARVEVEAIMALMTAS